MADVANHSLPVKKRRWTRIILIIMALVAAVGLAATIALVVFGLRLGSTFDSGTEQISNVFPDDGSRPIASDDGSQTILLLGSDTRGEIDTESLENTGSRSDTMMVMRIPADRQQVFVMSIMRDSWVYIEGVGEAKINAAMAYGGPALTVQTIENLLDTRIDHVAMIDFEGFKGLTDALGGVSLTNPEAFSAQGFDFPAGPIELNGEQALAFVRERYSFSSGDYHRVENQQLFIKAVMREMLSRGTLTNPGKIQDAVTAISPYIAVDSDLDSKYLMALLPSMRDVRTADITFFTMPTTGTGTSSDGQSIVVLDEARMADLSEAFKNDTLVDYVANHDLSAS